MDVVSEEQALQAVLGRGDFGGIDNEALDFSQLEDYINDEENDSTIYFSEALVGTDIKLSDTPNEHSAEKGTNGSTNSPIISSTSPDIRRNPSSLRSDNNFNGGSNVPSGASSSGSCGSPTVSTSQTFKLAIPPVLGNIQPVYHQSHHLPDSPPDSGSEPPFSPNNDDQKLSSSGSQRNQKIVSNNQSSQRLLSVSGNNGIPSNVMMQSQAESLKHYITYSGTQPLKHLTDNTSLTILSNSHSINNNLIPVGQHLTTTTSAGAVLTQLGTNIPSHLSSQLGNIQTSQQLTNLVQNPHHQALIPHTHLAGIYGSNEEFLCDSLSNASSTSNNPTKKRKLSDSPKNLVTSTVIGNGMPHIKRDPDGFSPEPTSSVILNPSEEDYSFDFNGSDNGMYMDSAYQCIRFQPFQPNTWHALCDMSMKELSPPNYRVDADKGFNFSNADEAFVCQKKNHFQVTVHIQAFGDPRYIKTPEGLKKVETFQLHFHGAKVESPSQTIKVEQSQSDRSKKPFYPVALDLSQEQVIKTTVGRLHFSETTSNNMRKKGKPNPDQRYFYLVVGLFAHIGELTYPIVAHASERIIVRASNPGQFENDMELSWQKGTTPESIYHAGRVGINTDRPDESLVVHGNIRLTGHIIQPSDARAKTNVQEMDSKEQLKNVANMKIVQYEYRPEFGRKAGLHKEELRGTGVIAQEVQFILPDAVTEAGDVVLDGGEKIENFLVVNKERIFMENVGAVKELCKVTDNLETRIEELERINRKLTKIKRLDSLKSTSSCSTVTSGSSINANKKSNHHTKKHQNRRRSSEDIPDGFSAFCSNRLVQGTMITLILVMAFCIVSVASLYILEYQRGKANERLLAGDRAFSSTESYLSSSKEPTISSSTVPSKHAQGASEKDASKSTKPNDFSGAQSINPVSLRTPSESITGRTSDIRNNSVSDSSKNLSSNTVIDGSNFTLTTASDETTLSPKLLGAHHLCSGNSQSLPASCVVHCCLSAIQGNEVGRVDTQGSRPTNYRFGKATDLNSQAQSSDNGTHIRAGLEGRSLNHSIVESQSLSGDDRTENEAVPMFEISDTRPNKTRHLNENNYNRSSNMYQAVSYLDHPSTLQDNSNSDNTVVGKGELDSSNRESDISLGLRNNDGKGASPHRSKRSDTRVQVPKKSAKELIRAVDNIKILEWNFTITSGYCTNRCSGSDNNYLIPMSKYMNLDSVKIQFRLSSPLIVEQCPSDDKTVACSSPPSNTVPNVAISDNNNGILDEVQDAEWTINVGQFLRSAYKFRIMSRADDNTSPCSLSSEELGRSFIEYNFVFERRCNK